MSWKTVKLKDVLKQYRIEHRVQDDAEYKQVTISKHTGVRFRGTKTGKDIGRKRQFLIDLEQYPQTLMLVRQGVFDGAIGIAPNEVDGCIATENMPMFSIENINIEYLTNLLKSSFFKEKLNKIPTTGSAQKSIHERLILEIEIPYPSLNEQEQIVKILNNRNQSVNTISTQLTHQLQLVKQLRQSFLREAMQGKLVAQNPNDEPATKLLSKIKAEKEQLIKEKKIRKPKPFPPITKKEIPYEIPKNWVWCRLVEIANIGTGATPLTSNNSYYKDGNIPWITSSATNNLFVEEPELYITEKALKETNCRIYPIGTLVIAMYGQGKTRGQITELMFKAATNHACATISLHFDDFFLRKFIKRYFQKIYNEIRKLAQGGAQPNLNMGKIKNTIIPLPPLSEQKRIVAKLDKLMRYCDNLEESIKKSQAQNEMLLRQVLREALEPKEKEVVL